MAMLKRQFTATLLIFMFLSSATIAGGEKSLLRLARKALAKGDYANAKIKYNKLLQTITNNNVYFFEAGLAYYNSEIEKEKSLGYFQNSLRLMGNDTLPEVFYYLGRAYHYVNEFDKAIESYKTFRHLIKNDKSGSILNREVDTYIEMCNNGKNYISHENKNIQIKNLGNRVNSIYSEYAPVVKKDESLLIFTARKAANVGQKLYNDNKKFEDIYISRLEDKKNMGFSYSTKFDSSGVYISNKINSKYHDAAIGYNEKEDKLFIYRQNDVWMSELVNGVWNEPIRMNSNINTKGHEPSVFITSDESALYFVSNRPDGTGGRDIWVAVKGNDGEWGEIKNMGSGINTEFDDDAPFLSKDGKTFYFSSRGHRSMGGYDIFKCEKDENGNWSAPQNLGVPFNSSGDDIYYIESDDNTWAYLSSSRAYGAGFMDIYRVQLGCKNIENTEVRGLLVATQREIPLDGKITVTEKESGKVYGPFFADKFTGKYLMVLPPEKTYSLELVSESMPASRPHHEDFTLPKQCEYFQLFQQIDITRFKDTSTKENVQQAYFKNAFFDIKKKADEKYNLDILKEPSEFGNIPQYDLTFTPIMISGNIGNDEMKKAKKIGIFLIDKNKQIVKTTTSDNKGNFSFTGLDPNEKYTLLIKEDDLKISYFGDASNNANKNIIVQGKIEKLTGLKSEIAPLENMDIVLVDGQKKSLNSTVTDKNGNFILSNDASKNPLNPIFADAGFPYRINRNDLDMIYSAYITILDTSGNELNYSEYIDKITYKEEIDSALLAELFEFENIYFDFDKFSLRTKSKEVMDKISAYMVSHKNSRIQIAGHCDWIGTDEYNIVLSENRSISAFNYLLNKGVESSRMNKKWYGESQPAAPNTKPDGTDDPKGRQLNRRVVFKLDIPNVAVFTITP